MVLQCAPCPCRPAMRDISCLCWPALCLLQVGSDDCDLRVYKSEDAVAETAEADRFVALCPLDLALYGYGLVNGTIGA